nr:leucyl aminopeptidase family protein [Caulobacter sp. S45]
MDEAGAPALLVGLGASAQAQAAGQRFTGKPGQVLVLVAAGGVVRDVVAGKAPDLWRALAARLPAGDYAVVEAQLTTEAATAWALGGYRFDRYKGEHDHPRPRLVAPPGVDLAAALRIAHACALARDMVNTPANDMGPLQIEAIAREIAQAHRATLQVVTGEDLLEQNYPAIHAVGRAATLARAPRLIEMVWTGPDAGEAAPHVVLVGKGVVFDTGGLDIKPSSGMRNMKKDMGGAAHALALARMVMGDDLPVRLTVLLPVVENAISADAMRPGDVLASRRGLSIEVGNTDAEGRLILADALTRAGELAPDLTIDLATLTGAARVALGPELPPFYTDDDALAAEIEAAARAVSDPLWRMPLWAAYDSALDSDVADLKNDPDAWAQAGSITAALFLKRFAPTVGAWVHLDVFAWNPRKRPGWPVGGEAQAIRALFQLLRRRYPALPGPGVKGVT